MNLPTVVLLVEDSEDDRMFFSRAIQKIGPEVRVTYAEDGQQAVDRLSGRGAFSDLVGHPRPTHVILDLKLPKLTGMEVLEWMRRKSAVRDVPVIILTSSESMEEIERVRLLGVDDYLVKPASFEKLLIIVRKIFSRWKL